VLPEAALPEGRRVAGRSTVLVAALGVAALLSVLYAGLGRRPGGEPGLGVNDVGAAVAVAPRAAPDLALATLDGSPFRLAEQRGKLVVVNFWASWCPPCREEAAALEREWQARRGGDVVFVGVNLWDRAPAARQFLELHAISYPSGTDTDGEAAIAYGVRGLPETFFVDRGGRIVRKWVGPLTQRQLAATLDDLAR
jgi:cytochrome c biogenesis protein CcmG, thiol:disulfide interchange protein DsbE